MDGLEQNDLCVTNRYFAKVLDVAIDYDTLARNISYKYLYTRESINVRFRD